MAKQTKSQTTPAKAPGATPQADAPATVEVLKGANDRFTAVMVMDGDKPKIDEKTGQPVFVEPVKKLAPQANCIINTIRAAGEKGLTRTELNANLKGVLVTRQPESRIVTYYQKSILASGAVTMVAAQVAAPAVPAAA